MEFSFNENDDLVTDSLILDVECFLFEMLLIIWSFCFFKLSNDCVFIALWWVISLANFDCYLFDPIVFVYLLLEYFIPRCFWLTNSVYDFYMFSVWTRFLSTLFLENFLFFFNRCSSYIYLLNSSKKCLAYMDDCFSFVFSSWSFNAI